MVERVSTASIAGMIASLVISIVLPIVLLIIWKKKTGAKVRPFLLGFATFIICALILETLFHNIVLSITGTAITDNLWLSAIYGGLCAGLFEETGRYFVMKRLMRNQLDRKNSVMYGIGHGGIESILVCGIGMIVNLATALMINSDSIEATLGSIDEATRATMISELSVLWTTEPFYFFMAGVERISAIFLQIALSYIIYKAVKNQDIKMYIIAVVIHLVVDAEAVILLAVFSVPVLEMMIILEVVALWVYIYKFMWIEEEPYNELQ